MIRPIIFIGHADLGTALFTFEGTVSALKYFLNRGNFPFADKVRLFFLGELQFIIN
jgi:hypothetical protein